MRLDFVEIETDQLRHVMEGREKSLRCDGKPLGTVSWRVTRSDFC